MDVLRARARELVQRAGLGEVPAGTLAIGAAVALVVLCAALWQWWPGRGDAGLAGSISAGTVSTLASPNVTARALGSSAVGESEVGATVAESKSPERTLLVHVVGAVRRPGVYGLNEGARVRDAVDAAGGLLGSAAQASVNLARVVADGEQIYVPTQDEVEKGVGHNVGSPGVQPQTGAPGSPTGGAAAGPSMPVNINTADAALLDTLPGIGPTTAAKIVAEREANGPFASVDDLGRVSGIGAKKLEDLKGLVVTR